MGSSQAYRSVCLSVCMYVSTSFHLSVSLSGRLHHFLVIICADRKFAQRMRPQDMGSNPLSGSIICPPVRSSAHPFVHQIFANFVFVFNSFNNLEMITITINITSVGVQRRNTFIPTLGSSQAYMSVPPSNCSSVRTSLCLSVQSYTVSLTHQ